MTNKDAKKKARGAYDYRSDGTIVCVKWNDSGPVMAASNFFGISPVQISVLQLRKSNRCYPFEISQRDSYQFD